MQLFDTSKDFEELFKAYFTPLCNFVYAQLHNWEDSREVVQNTFAKIWGNRGRLEIHSSKKSYLFQAARNTMIDYIRKSSKLSELDKQQYHDRLADLREDPDTYIIRNEIMKAMSVLKPKNKRIFELNKFHGLTYKEIAIHLDISERSVEDNIARAIRILRDELKDNQNLYG